ncbi:hypothetical protein QLX08_011622 [Tetragonisca angustula]|uniref:Uncharacterized protein n=1 Tax=Tetragonisca angustula TaxID=166442 RepID=A0AAW0Z7S4_9HYME
MVGKRRLPKYQRTAGSGKNTRKVDFGDEIKREKEQSNTLNIKYSWPDVCKKIPKCVLFRAYELREIASKGLGPCSYKMVDEFLMFAFEELIEENALTVEKFIVLQERADNLIFSDAQLMFKAIVAIRRKFNETANKPANNIKLTDYETASLIGLKFNYKERVSDSERTKPAENTREIVDSSLKFKTEGMEPVGATIGPKFLNEKYEEKMDEYYKNQAPTISRQIFKRKIIDTLKSANFESELADFLGFEAIEFMEYIIQHRDSIIASDSDERTSTQSQEQQLWKTVTKMDKISNKMSSERGKKRNKKIMTLN